MGLAHIITLIVACLLPILAWAYVVTYFDSTQAFQAKYVLGGLLGGAITSTCIFLLSRYIDPISLYFPSIAVGVLYIIALIEYFVVRSTQKKSIYLWFLIGSLILLVTLTLSGMYGTWISTSILTACILASMEELGKGFHGPIYTQKSGSLLLTGVYVALGFAFIENILYLFGNWSAVVYVGRFMLSTPLHIIASIIVLAGLVVGRKKVVFLFFLLLGVAYHATYNLLLENKSAIFALGLIALGYFFVGKLYTLPKQTEKV